MLFDNVYIYYIILYLFIYNISLYILFNILNYFYIELKTLNLLNKLNNFYVFKIWTLVILFSIAGIPPFFGFFIKLTLIYSISYVSFIISLPLTVLIIISLYFYLQNVRYLMWLDDTNIKQINWSTTHLTLYLFYINTFLIFFLIYGFFLYDDVILLLMVLFL